MSRAVAVGIAVIQLVFAARFFIRVIATLHGKRIESASSAPTSSVTVVVPVLDEVNRIGACLEALERSGGLVREILVVDGGSRDGTHFFVERFSERHPRTRSVDAGQSPDGWNGKAWNLQTGLRCADETSDWLVTIDADVEVSANGIADAVAFAEQNGVPFISVATTQRAPSRDLALVHPSLLSTLVYRFGIPGHVARTLDEVQANGQFAVYRRRELARAGGFEVARDSICDDVTLARHLFLSGYQIGFYEGNDIGAATMYPSGPACLRNWPRSLSLRDRFDRSSGVRGLVRMFFLQVVPVISLVWMPAPLRQYSWLSSLNRALAAVRFGVAFGTYRAYARPPLTYWLSPLADPLSWIVYAYNLTRRRHTWRGRQLVSEER